MGYWDCQSHLHGVRDAFLQLQARLASDGAHRELFYTVPNHQLDSSSNPGHHVDSYWHRFGYSIIKQFDNKVWQHDELSADRL